ncbi:DinB family protein [Metabacillus sp. GX 13764]|uniref:DinB family protein n=1 Tax=Metabacillus kandeliae TaxID=2900151 RepID=UPI001E3A1482|nr:DinB family protein [Metabacillus kandeliae]MCD7036408.1 DinB family protein [Metabacillus kandeliae]
MLSEKDYPEIYNNYVRLVPNGDIKEVLLKQREETVSLLSSISKETAGSAYAEEKWTVKEVIGHITDTERIMSERLLRFSRGDSTPLPGYNDEQYVREAEFNRFSMAELLESFSAVRGSTLALLKMLPGSAWEKEGTANNGRFTVRGLAAVIAGHELHHKRILKERYLASDS